MRVRRVGPRETVRGTCTPPSGQFLGNRRRSVGCVASPSQDVADGSRMGRRPSRARRRVSPMGRGRVAARRGPVASSVGVSSVLGGGSGGFVVHPPLRYHVRLAASGRRRLVQTGGSELCLSSASAPQRVEAFGGVSDVSDVSDVSECRSLTLLTLDRHDPRVSPV